jgi:ABC-type polysaccharide/polyol phosphate transport system ATPase subunit
MGDTVIKVEDLSKQYRLGEVSTGTLSHDINRWWHRMRGKEDPYLKIGETNDRTSKGNSDYVWALRDVNFEVKQGEVLGIIGRNGAGKSTLLKILSRTTLPTVGEIKLKGRIASLLEVGTGFHPELTGRDNIFLNGAILGMTKREIKARFDEIVDFSGVERYVDTPVKRYSSGMYVRLAFAVAAFLEPDILIVDEVLAVGDAEFQKKCLGKMKDVSDKDGRTVLFVSHNMAAISALCTKAILLGNGKIEFDGRVDDTLKKYIFSRKIDSNGQIFFNEQEKERFGEKRYAHWRSITLSNQSGVVTDVFTMGEKMKISLELDVVTPSDDFEIGIGIGNMQEVFTHYLVSTWEGFSSIPKTGNTTLEVEVPQLYLFPGNYLVNIWICIKGAYYDDAIHNAINFKVVEGKVNAHDTYFERFSKNTQVYTPSLWKIK